ncbi:hypothetical protein [Fibrella aquatilis]|uniref:Uncharacterized protein n=1 Tax=Fibrella aquatilis TaxID=2817059 RepID=A0A939GBP1_9BACT|nr:hypothetical protein [Fibrella aquatilis]MBO0933726.1 hypothetical protein [Fibrella aquatilis]
MKTSLIALATILTGFYWIGCQNRQTTTETTTDSIATGTSGMDNPTTSCYAYSSAADTMRMTLNRTGNEVTGDLLYKLSGKDRNTGTITGTMHGDTLRAEYSFHSEGVESMREVAFLVNGDKLTEGYGPVTEKNGKMMFTPGASQTFDSKMALVKVACTE